MTYLVIPKTKRPISAKDRELLEATLKFFGISYSIVSQKAQTVSDYSVPMRTICQSARKAQVQRLLNKLHNEFDSKGVSFYNMTVGDFLRTYSKDDLRKWKGFGLTTIDALSYALSKMGYEWY